MPLIIFDLEIWICLVVCTFMCFIVMSFLKFAHEFAREDEDERLCYRIESSNLALHIARSNLIIQYIQIFIDVLILMTSSPFRRFSANSSDRFVIASICIVSLNFVSVFQSGLSTAYTKPSFYTAIDTLEQLDESGKPIIIKVN